MDRRPDRQRLRQLWWRALERWLDHGAPTRAAAIAFYTLTSLAPLSVLLVWIGTAAWESVDLRVRISARLTQALGSEATALIEAVLADAALPSSEAFVPTVMASLVFVFSATAVLSQLQSALRDIWEEPPGKASRVFGFLKHRLVALALVGVLGVALTVFLGTSVLVASLTASVLSGSPSLMAMADLLVSIVTLAGLFTLVLKILPAARVRWSEALLGGAVTGVLHIAGQELAGAYLRRFAVGSAWGAASSLVVFLFWVYVSSLVFLYGAEVSRALSQVSEG